MDFAFRLDVGSLAGGDEMQVTLQDCGCVALPVELQDELGVGAGAIFEVGCLGGELRLSVVSGGDTSGVRVGAACPVLENRTDLA